MGHAPRGLRGAGESAADMNESEHLISVPRSRLLSPGPSSWFNHPSLSWLCTKGRAQWKQFAHYAFIEAQPFITFIPCLCPNESREQGWNVKTLWRLFLMGELRDLDNTDKAAAEIQSTELWGLAAHPGVTAVPEAHSHLDCWDN